MQLVIFKEHEDWVEASGYGVLFGSSERVLVGVQESQFLKTLHQDGGEDHKLLRNSRFFRYREDVAVLRQVETVSCESEM